MQDESFLRLLASPEGRPFLETLRSLQATPTRWLTVSEVAERNRYGHLVIQEDRQRQILETLADRGLAQRLSAATATNPVKVTLDINACCPRQYQAFYTYTKAGTNLLAQLSIESEQE